MVYNISFKAVYPGLLKFVLYLISTVPYSTVLYTIILYKYATVQYSIKLPGIELCLNINNWNFWKLGMKYTNMYVIMQIKDVKTNVYIR